MEEIKKELSDLDDTTEINVVTKLYVIKENGNIIKVPELSPMTKGELFDLIKQGIKIPIVVEVNLDE